LMPISLDSAPLIPLTEATRYCPRRRQGRKPHRTTLYRWATRGYRGIYLETLETPGGLFTSKEAMERFYQRLKRARHPCVPQPPQ